jgi:hypothetical protein
LPFAELKNFYESFGFKEILKELLLLFYIEIENLAIFIFIRRILEQEKLYFILLKIFLKL